MFKAFRKDLGIISYIFKIAYKICPSYVFLVVVLAMVKALTPFIGIIIPKFMIDELLGEQRLNSLIALVVGLALSHYLLNTLTHYLDYVIKIQSEKVYKGFSMRIGEQVMNMSFEKIEDPQILDLKERALYPIQNQGAIYQVLTNSVTILQHIVFSIGAIFIVGTLHPIIPMLIVGIILLNTVLYQKLQQTMYTLYQKIIPINRKFNYYLTLTGDASMGKDIRLYNLSSLILNKLIEFRNESLSWLVKINRNIGRFGAINAFMTQCQLLIVYAYMTFQVVKDVISIGDFSMYINATTQFSSALNTIISQYIEVSQMCRYLEHYLEFEKSIKPETSTVKEEVPQHIDTLEFKNVSFKYPRSESYVLKDINVTIKAGEHVSLVGLNGAGKTTFIKLLTRLYRPSSGEILLNGININHLDEQLYQNLLAVVFQDFKTLAFSVKENICFSEACAVKDELVYELLNHVGLSHEIEKLPEGVHTSLYKTFDEKGVEFSGGMAQKLAISRAIFKNSSLIILDEPTAALDPMAEAEIFDLFHDLVKDKTTIYISHRLSSCRLSDYVVVFNQGTIEAIGTHELLVEGDGVYAQMFQAQATYYKESEVLAS